MTLKEDVKHLLREDLGCTCPDQVFESIEYGTQKLKGEELPEVVRIVIGNRLLLYVWSNVDQKNISALVSPVFESGIREREGRKLNKFRLVIASPTPKEMRLLIEKQVDLSNLVDEQTHLHIVDITGNVRPLLSR